MANLAAVLKGEIARVARREIKLAVEPLRKSSAGYRREIAEVKRQVGALQRELKSAGKVQRGDASANVPAGPTPRFMAQGLRSLRARLDLSAADFGRLIGASGQSVYNWEAGKAVPRATQQSAIASVRGLGKREARRRLAAQA
jgi:DNA-binding transcriptional regulator YiaG